MMRALWKVMLVLPIAASMAQAHHDETEHDVNLRQRVIEMHDGTRKPLNSYAKPGEPHVFRQRVIEMHDGQKVATNDYVLQNDDLHVEDATSATAGAHGHAEPRRGRAYLAAWLILVPIVLLGLTMGIVFIVLLATGHRRAALVVLLAMGLGVMALGALAALTITGIFGIVLAMIGLAMTLVAAILLHRGTTASEHCVRTPPAAPSDEELRRMQAMDT